MRSSPRSGLRRLWLTAVVFFLGVTVVDCTCPVGWVPVQLKAGASTCFKFYGNLKKTFDAAQTYCQSQGGYLARSTNSRIQQNLNAYIYSAGKSGTKPTSFWIGLTDTNKALPWKWVGVGGQQLGTFNNWPNNKAPYNSKYRQNCIFISTKTRTGTWTSSTTCDAIRAFVCQKGPNATPPTTKPMAKVNCPSRWYPYQAGKTCLYLSYDKKSFVSARTYCKSQGGDLVKITDGQMSGFLTGLIAKRRAVYFIGLNDIKKEGTYVWNDESTKAKYTHWNSNEPNDYLHNEDCTTVLISGKWNDVTCTTPTQFICQRHPVSAPVTKKYTTTTKSTPTPSANCGSGWEEDKSSIYCYQIKRDRQTWTNASALCKKAGGILATIPSSETQAYLTGRVQSYSDPFFWIGANDQSSEGGWRWYDYAPFAFVNWDEGQPDRRYDQDCVGMVPSTGKWNDLVCSQKYGYICQKKGKRTAPTIPPKTTPTKIPAGRKWGCPPGWSGFRGSCYMYFYSKYGGMTWFSARTYCRSGHQAELISISDYAENYFVQSRIPSDYPYDIWIGLNDNGKENTFVWSDNSPITFTNWDRNQPDDNGDQDCVKMSRQNGRWDDVHCTKSLRQLFVCEKSMSILSKTSTALTDGCPQYYLGLDNKCYGVSDTKRTFDDANTQCKQRKGTLAIVNSNIVQAFLVPYMSIRAGSAYWIGLSLQKSNHYTYSWIDGSDLRFTNWARTHTGNENNTCVAMQVSKPAGLWLNRPCSATKLPYLCQVPRKGPYTAPTTRTTVTKLAVCPSDWLQKDSMCYKIFGPKQASDRLTWREARTKCESFAEGGTLVSIPDSSFFSWLYQKVYQGSSTYDRTNGYWIGLNDLDQENGFEWTDGSPVKWTSWQYGQPDNKLSQDCVMWDATRSYRGWQDDQCSLAHNYICQFPRGATVYTPAPTVSVGPTGGANCGNANWTYFGLTHKCYYISPESGDNSTASWFEAQEICHGMGAELTSIGSQDENTLLITLTSKHNTQEFWLGMNDIDNGVQRWVDNSPVVFLAWERGVLNDNDADRCVKLMASGSWIDYNCNNRLGFICKRNSGTYHPVIKPTTLTKGNCPAGYFTHPLVSHCYKVYSDLSQTSSFADAQRMCGAQTTGGSLATIHNDFENDLIVTHLRGLKAKVWIGMKREHGYNKPFRWMDGSQVKYVNWAPTENRLYYTSQKCAAFTNEGSKIGQWISQSCYTYNGYVCQRLKSTSFLKPFSDNEGCNPGYRHFGNSCYKLYTSTYTWSEAEQVCIGDQGHLMSITDGFESALFNVLTASNSSEYWLGLKYNAAVELYSWSDGWPVTYVQWGEGQPARQDGGGCISSNISTYWEDSSCLKSLPFVCEMNLGTPPVPTGFVYGVCADDWVTYRGSCYYFETATTGSRAWAKVDCKNKGGTLASILSRNENEFIPTQFKTSYYRMFWIGLRPSVSSGYHWDDGSPVDYTYFDSSKPRFGTAAPTEGTEKHEMCIVMSGYSYWTKIDCYENHGYICKKPQKSALTSPSTVSTTKSTSRSTIRITSPTTMQTNKPNNKPTNILTTTTQSTTLIITRPNEPQTHPPTTQSTQPSPQTNQQGHQKGASSSDDGMSGGSVAGIVIGVLAVAVIVLLVVVFVRRGSADGLLTRFKSSKSSSTSYRPSQEASGFDNMIYHNTSGSLEGPHSSDA